MHGKWILQAGRVSVLSSDFYQPLIVGWWKEQTWLRQKASDKNSNFGMFLRTIQENRPQIPIYSDKP
jgi:hypothetical protein